MQTLRIFISSPCDVIQERNRAREVIEGLRRRYGRHFALKPVFWEDLPLPPDISFQEGIDVVLSDQGVDIAVFILWSRLGSPLGASIRKPDGTEYRSGTEREYDLMIRARARSREKEGTARPAMLVYTRSDDASFAEALRAARTTEEQKKLIDQKEQVESFLAEIFQDQASGTNIGAYFPFDRPVTFSQRLRVHLQGVLDEMAGDLNEVVWDTHKQGPPFLGLEAFQPQHADIFFGREEEIHEARNALKHKAAEGCAFLLISGASGSGKSSLARAGLMPEIVNHELDAQIAAWLHLVTTPAELGADPIAGLVTQLAASDCLPELHAQAMSLDELSRDLAKDPEPIFRHTFRKALEAASVRKGGNVRLLIVLDQLEELFTTAFSPGQRAVFLTLVEVLVRSGQVWVVTTARSDFYAQIQSEPALVRLKEGRGLLDLLSPSPDAIQRLIEEPARLAGISFEEREGQSLAGRILRDAAPHKELLPLLEFVLLELFARRDDKNRLKFTAYEELGGVEGALARRAEETFAAMSGNAQQALGEVLQSIVTLGEEGADGETEKVVRQHEPMAAFFDKPAALRLIEAFIAARLFTTGLTSGEASFTLAHESLLRVWPRALKWKALNADFLRTRARISTRMKEGSPLLKGDPLLDTAKAFLITHRDAFSTIQREWIQNSTNEADRKECHRVRMRRVVMVSLSLLTMGALFAALWAWKNGEEAIEQKRNADAKTREVQQANTAIKNNLRIASNADLAASFRAQAAGQHDASLAYLQRALRLTPDNPALIASVHGAQLPQAGPFGVRFKWRFDSELTTLAFSPTEPFLAAASSDGRLCLFNIHSGILVWSIRFKNGFESLVFSPDGTRLAASSGSFDLRVLESSTGKEMWSTSDIQTTCIDFSPDGRYLATGSPDGTKDCLRLFDAASGEILWSQLPGQRAEAISFSPDSLSLVAGVEDRTGGLTSSYRVQVLAVESGESLWQVGLANHISDLAYSPDGRFLAAAGGIVKVLAADSGALLKEHTLSSPHVLTFTPDSSNLLVGLLGDLMLLSDANTGTIRWRKPVGRTIGCLAVSPDGSIFAAGTAPFSDSFPVSLSIHSISDGTTIQELSYSSSTVSTAFYHDGTFLATASSDRTLRLFQASSNRLCWQRSLDRTDDVMLMTPDCSGIGVLAWDSKKLQLIDVSSGRVRWSRILSEPPYHLLFSPDGKYLAMDREGQIVICDTASGKELRSVDLKSPPQSLSFSPDGSRLAIATQSRGIHVISPDSGEQIWKAEIDRDIQQLLHSPNGSWLSVCNRNPGERAEILLFDAEAPNILWRHEGDNPWDPANCEYSPDGALVSTGPKPGAGHILRAATGKPLRPDGNPIYTKIVHSPVGGSVAVTLLGESILQQLNSATGEVQWTSHFPDSSLRDIEYSGDGKFLAVGTSNGGLRVLEPVSGDLLWEHQFDSLVWKLCFSNDGIHLAIATGEQSLWIMMTETGQVIWHNPNAPVNESLAFVGPNRLLASGPINQVLNGLYCYDVGFRNAPADRDEGALLEAILGTRSVDLFDNYGRTVNVAAEAIDAPHRQLQELLLASPSHYASKVIRDLLLPPVLQKVSQDSDILLRESISIALQEASSGIDIQDSQDRAPWHPLAPASLARLSENSGNALRKEFLFKLTLTRLRSVDADLWGKKNLAEDAAHASAWASSEFPNLARELAEFSLSLAETSLARRILNSLPHPDP